MNRIMSKLIYPEHEEIHGVENKVGNIYRIWVCEDCGQFFTDTEIREDLETGQWGHKCKMSKRTDYRCESHLEAYLPDIGNTGS